MLLTNYWLLNFIIDFIFERKTIKKLCPDDFIYTDIYEDAIKKIIAFYFIFCKNPYRYTTNTMIVKQKESSPKRNFFS